MRILRDGGGVTGRQLMPVRLVNFPVAILGINEMPKLDLTSASRVEMLDATDCWATDDATRWVAQNFSAWSFRQWVSLSNRR